jgi:ATP-binding cassette subfamily F protein 3
MLDDLSSAAPRAKQTELRSLLGCFLFSEDDVFKRIGVLSGGERNRYALARMLLAPSNFLLLDEPTNHLDMRAKEVLLEALRTYSGTVVFVSHDRYFIDHLASRVFEIEEGHVHVYPGTYEDYLWRKQGGPEALAAVQHVKEPEPVAAPQPVASEEPKKRVNPMKLQKLRDRLKSLEGEVATLESQIAEGEAALGDFKSVEETQRLTDMVASNRTALEKRLAEWEDLSAQLEEPA